MRGEISEFRSKLRKQGYNLCLPLGASLPMALKAFGYEVGQEVVVRFHHDRLEIFPRSSPELLREKVLDELKGFKERIEAYRKELPWAPEEETLEAELQRLLERLVANDLDPAIAKLRSVALFGPPGEGRQRASGTFSKKGSS